MNRTPIADTEYKHDIIEHINEDHADDVLDVALTYGDPDARSARVADIFQEGMLIAAETASGKEAGYFVPFELASDDIGEQLHYIVFRAAAEQGKPLSGSKRQYFTVVSNRKTTPNMQRLVLLGDSPVPEREPGYAWYFQLKIHSRREAQDFSPVEQAEQKRLIEAARDSSSEERGRVFESFFEGLRYYTLRRAEKSRPDAPFADTAVVDVYLHGGTEGSRWAAALRTGDIVCSSNDFHEHTAHLHQGRAVLIGDETALPTVSALLEQWRNPQPPLVVAITQDEADQAYLAECALPENTRIKTVCGSANIPADVITLLAQEAEIDAVWGAFEASDATAVRKYLAQRGLPRSRNRVKGYWRR